MLPSHIRLVSLADIGCTEELREDQPTLEGNSLQKADYVNKKYNIACFADDTGLEVFALNGEPGVKSARYAGDDRDNEKNIDLLINKLQGESNREAQFRTVITLISNGDTHQFEGVVRGQIIDNRTGGQGFGYDPVFIPEGFDKTFAEMTVDEKNKVSHRSKATHKLVEYLSTQIKTK